MKSSEAKKMVVSGDIIREIHVAKETPVMNWAWDNERKEVNLNGGIKLQTVVIKETKGGEDFTLHIESYDKNTLEVKCFHVTFEIQEDKLEYYQLFDKTRDLLEKVNRPRLYIEYISLIDKNNAWIHYNVG